MRSIALFCWVSLMAIVGSASIVELAIAQEGPKWFVLRQETASYCRTALLIRIDGAYVSGGSLIAGGPFEMEAEALAHQKGLAERGVCARA